jgi:hypothetical protein
MNVSLLAIFYPMDRIPAPNVERRSGHDLNIHLKSAAMIIPGSGNGRVHGIGEGVSERKGEMTVYRTEGREDGKGRGKGNVQV